MNKLTVIGLGLIAAATMATGQEPAPAAPPVPEAPTPAAETSAPAPAADATPATIPAPADAPPALEAPAPTGSDSPLPAPVVDPSGAPVSGLLPPPTQKSSGGSLGGLSEMLGNLKNLNINGDSTTYDTATGRAIAKGNVRAKFPDTEIYADQAEYDAQLNEVHVVGNVSIYRAGTLYRGEEATYNLTSKELDTRRLRSFFESPSAQGPLFFKSEHMKTKTESIDAVDAEEASFSTEDSQDPDWFIKAKEVKIYPDDRIVFKNPTIYAGGVPVFWLPYLAQPLNEELGYTFTPGYKSNWGLFLENTYGTLLGDHSILKYHLDLRSDRGIAGGIDLLSRRWKDNQYFGKFQAYYANDSSPLTTGVAARNEDRTNLDSDRYRINFHHRVYLPGPDESTLYVDFDINKLSDEFFYEDFFPTEFRIDPQPDNYIGLVKQHERGELSVLTRFRANDFYQTDTRLPEIALDFTRQPIFDTGAFYWGSTIFGVYDEKISSKRRAQLLGQISNLEDKLGDPLADTTIDDRTLLDDLKSQTEEAGFTRFHSYHEALYPFTIGDWLNITPKLGVGLTTYSGIDGPQPENDTRTLFHAGVDVSFKASKMYENIQMPNLGVDGLLHVVQPYMNWSFLSSDSLGDGFKRIDRFAPSTRLRSIDIPQFTAIDDLNSWNILRLGVSNRLLTKRGNGTSPWLTSNTYFDVFMDDPEFNRDFSNVFQEFAWYPLPWLRLDMGMQLPLLDNNVDFTEFNTALTFMPVKDFEFSIGNRILQNHPFFEDSNLIDFRTYTHINDNWGLSTYHRYETDDNTLETQQYSIHRDLTSWAGALGLVIRDNRGKSETGVVFSLTLKDFPGVAIPLNLDAGGR